MRSAGHQESRIIAGKIEEREIGRRVIKEAGKHAGEPEVSRIDGLSVRVGN